MSRTTKSSVFEREFHVNLIVDTDWNLLRNFPCDIFVRDVYLSNLLIKVVFT